MIFPVFYLEFRKLEFGTSKHKSSYISITDSFPYLKCRKRFSLLFSRIKVGFAAFQWQFRKFQFCTSNIQNCLFLSLYWFIMNVTGKQRLPCLYSLIKFVVLTSDCNFQSSILTTLKRKVVISVFHQFPIPLIAENMSLT